MRKPAIPGNETRRLMMLRSLHILDTLPEERFDRITRIARRMFGVPIALISLIDADRQWVKSRQGIEVTEAPRELSFCGHAICDGEPLVVPDASADERFHDNPFVLDDPAIRFYAGLPLHATGAAVGTLCLLDRKPRTFSDDELATLRDLAAMVEDELVALQSATTDVLTGISNRRGFDALAGKALALARRFAGPVTLLLFDLDGFKLINDQLGHAIGDQALVDFASTLVKTFRDADVVARLGGDEFVVLAAGNTSTMAAPLARLAANLAALDERPYELRFSVGAAELAPDKQTLDAMIAAADAAMYETKRARKR